MPNGAGQNTETIKDSFSIPLLGLTPGDGKMSLMTQTQPPVLQSNQAGLRSKSESSKIIEKWTNQDKAKLALVMGRVCSLQRQYGKTPGDLETLVEGFAWAMGRYSVGDVIRAIGEFILAHPDIPTPADIRAIIDPIPPPFKPNWAVYTSLKKLQETGGAYALGTDEINYLARCESMVMDNG